jgi:hypothetical protein
MTLYGIEDYDEISVCVGKARAMPQQFQISRGNFKLISVEYIRLTWWPFCQKCSFHHNLNRASDQITYFMKVSQFGSLSK